MRFLATKIWNARFFQLLFAPEMAQMRLDESTRLKAQILHSIALRQETAAAQGAVQGALEAAASEKARNILNFDPTAVNTPPPGTPAGDACQEKLGKRFSKQYAS